MFPSEENPQREPSATEVREGFSVREGGCKFSIENILGSLDSSQSVDISNIFRSIKCQIFSVTMRGTQSATLISVRTRWMLMKRTQMKIPLISGNWSTSSSLSEVGIRALTKDSFLAWTPFYLCHKDTTKGKKCPNVQILWTFSVLSCFAFMKENSWRPADPL